MFKPWGGMSECVCKNRTMEFLGAWMGYKFDSAMWKRELWEGGGLF